MHQQHTQSGTFVTPAEVFADLSPYSGGGSAKTVDGARKCRESSGTSSDEQLGFCR
jgi:hypothetical protein